MEATIKKRPGLITTVCVLGFLGITYSFPAVFSPSIKKLGDWYPALFGLIVASSFMAYIGLWHMKRWGASLFIVTFFIKEIILVIIKDVSYMGILFSVFFIIIIVIYYKKMDQNL